MTYLRALAEVEASVEYWEEKGLIERLRHPGIDLIAFIHKTCGEFAAALHLSDMSPNETREAIETVLTDPDWDEILDFATGTQLASMLRNCWWRSSRTLTTTVRHCIECFECWSVPRRLCHPRNSAPS